MTANFNEQHVLKLTCIMVFLLGDPQAGKGRRPFQTLLLWFHDPLVGAKEQKVCSHTRHKLLPMQFKQLSALFTSAKSERYLQGCDADSLGICLVWGGEPCEWHWVSLLTPRPGWGPQALCASKAAWGNVCLSRQGPHFLSRECWPDRPVFSPV